MVITTPPKGSSEPNENCLEGWKCPKCGHTENFKVEAVRHITVDLCDDGTDDKGGDTTWENDSAAECGGCGLKATTFVFQCGDTALRAKFDELVERRRNNQVTLDGFIDLAKYPPMSSKALQNLGTCLLSVRELDDEIRNFNTS